MKTQVNPTQYGLSFYEYKRICSALKREPNDLEMNLFSVMWSEHCSYKSSKHWIQQLPTQSECVLQGPGENAGIVSIGDDDVVVFKIESHNHPSFIDPFQGSATGVGGILRDIFTMGARPIALLNAIYCPEPHKEPHFIQGITAGISHYGNCIGIPTVGGKITFSSAYSSNVLVNVMAVGLAKRNNILKSGAEVPGTPVFYLGTATGRDGVEGAAMASASFNNEAPPKTTIQVGDPFSGKILMDTCLRLAECGCILAAQDMGAAGLTCASSEMATKGKTGIEIHLDRVPQRHTIMSDRELMLSETQERMLLVIDPLKKEEAKMIVQEARFLHFEEIGVITDDQYFTIKNQGLEKAKLPVSLLTEGAVMYKRHAASIQENTPRFFNTQTHRDALTCLETMISSLRLCSRSWIFEQFDSLVGGETIRYPDSCDASIVGVPGTCKALALTIDGTPRYCERNAFEGGKQAVAENYRNLIAVHAQPLAFTNNLNFGDPSYPEEMGRLKDCILGMAAAAQALNYPTVSGNVSLYNTTNGVHIPPSPSIGGVGLIEDITSIPTITSIAHGDSLFLIGKTEGILSGTLYEELFDNQSKGAPPPVDLEVEKRHGAWIQHLFQEKLIHFCRDLSDGGLLLAIARVIILSRQGVSLKIDHHHHGLLFGEDQGRYIIFTRHPEEILKLAETQKIACLPLGTVEGQYLSFSNENRMSIQSLDQSYNILKKEPALL